jgi:hypothetical protein
VTQRSFAFRPRYRGIAWTAISVGGSMVAVAVTLGFAMVPLVGGAMGVALGSAYLVSPTWQIAVTIDDSGITVGSERRLRFRLAWNEVVRVVASPTTRSCFVDGGTPDRSLLVPGDGAPASYDITDRGELVDAILAHVPADKVKIVASLDKAGEIKPG